MSLVFHVCVKCGLEVPPAGGSLTVDVREAMRFSKARDLETAEQLARENTWGNPIRLERFTRPEDEWPDHARYAMWQPLHNDCFPEADAHLYGVPVGDVATLDGYMRSTQHLAGKRWFKATNWHEYWLGRAVDMRARSQRTKADMPYIVYCAYGERDELLYVGITYHFPRRKAQHKKDSRWYPLAKTWDWREYATREVAREAELHIIATEFPLFNEDGAVA